MTFFDYVKFWSGGTTSSGISQADIPTLWGGQSKTTNGKPILQTIVFLILGIILFTIGLKTVAGTGNITVAV